MRLTLELQPREGCPEVYEVLGVTAGDLPRHDCAPAKHPERDLAPGWMPIICAPLGVPLILAALDYGGHGKHSIGVGIGLPPVHKPGACVRWMALFKEIESCDRLDSDRLHAFTPTHWKPLPHLFAKTC